MPPSRRRHENANRKREAASQLSGISCSQSSLAAILKKLRGLDLQDDATLGRRDLYRSNKELLDFLKLEIPLELEDGGEWTWPLLDPAKLLIKMIGDNPRLQQAERHSLFV